ncbi:ribose-phosphate diphosphokinase, partial [Patescibacteria group bacterium]|nr:ribose-phosphate diphosphokinase [Patescibacteria group bacterium]
MSRFGALKIFSGTANPKLATDICRHLNIDLSPISINFFSDGELDIEIGECADGRGVRGDDIFFIQPTCGPVNDNLVELVLAIDAFKRASAGRITAVIPYYGYARQDRKVRAGVPISSKAIAIMIMGAGANRVIFMDLHAPQIGAFFEIPVDHLYASPIIIDYLRANLKDFIMVSPDAGGVERTRAYAKRLNADLAIIDKRRERANVAEAMNVIGDVRG